MGNTNTNGSRPSAATWEQLASRVRQAIIRGELTPGQVLPNLDVFAREHHVGRTTAQHALKLLANEGWLVRRRRAGTIVNPDRSTVRPYVAVLAPPLLLMPASPYTCVAIPALVHGLRSADLPAKFFHHVMLDPKVDPFAHLVEDDLSTAIEKGRVCGVIVLGHIPDRQVRLLEQIQATGLPMVECAYDDPAKLRCPVVMFDYFSLARRLVETVKQQGARRIATVIGPAARNHDIALSLASVLALHRRFMPAELQVKVQEYRAVASFMATRTLLDSSKPPDAIVVFDDLLALGVDEAITQNTAAARRGLHLATQANLGARLPFKQSWHQVCFDPWEQMRMVIRLLQQRIRGELVPRTIERLQPVDADGAVQLEKQQIERSALIVPLGHLPESFTAPASRRRRHGAG